MSIFDSKLPDLKTQFATDHFEPTQKELSKYRASAEAIFEQAKEKYEHQHGHQFPYSFRTFARHQFGWE